MRVLLINRNGFYKYMDIPELLPTIEIPDFKKVEFFHSKDPSELSIDRIKFYHYGHDGRHHIYMED